MYTQQAAAIICGPLRLRVPASWAPRVEASEVAAALTSISLTVRVVVPGCGQLLAYDGEVALAMNIPRTATVTTMTPCVVASCDAAAFDELVRPIFADDGDGL